jgi:hypothetical protein
MSPIDDKPLKKNHYVNARDRPDRQAAFCP